MIATLTGVLLHKDENHVVLDVQGVGYEVLVSPLLIAQLPAVGATVRLEIHTHMSDSQIHLHGFLTALEKALFKKLISVSGIGPKLGTAMVSAMPQAELIQAIILEDVAKLKSISGVGLKTAQRVVMELKDKFKDMPPELGVMRRTFGNDVDSDVLQALISLGYSDGQARRALQLVSRTANDNVQTLIKKSLGALNA